MSGSIAERAQQFLDHYIQGKLLPDQNEKTFPGIRRRVPAVLDSPSDLEEIDHPELDGTRLEDEQAIEEERNAFSPALNFDSERAILRDLCSVEKGIANGEGNSLKITLLWCSSYPASIFPDDNAANPDGRVFPIESDGQPSLIASEIVLRMSEFFGEEWGTVNILVEIVPLVFEELENLDNIV